MFAENADNRLSLVLPSDADIISPRIRYSMLVIQPVSNFAVIYDLQLTGARQRAPTGRAIPHTLVRGNILHSAFKGKDYP